MILTVVPLMLLMAAGYQLLNHHNADRHTPCMPVSIVGEYSTDGQIWQPLDGAQPFLGSDVTRFTLRGGLSQAAAPGQRLILPPLRNLWGGLRVNGAVAATNQLKADGSVATTPGHSILSVPADELTQDAQVELTLSNPYPLYQADPFSETLARMSLGTRDGLYAQMVQEQGWAIALYLVLCMAVDVSTVYGATVTSVLYLYTSLRGQLGRQFMAGTLALAVLSSCAAVCLHLTGVLDMYYGQLLLFPAIALTCTGGMVFLRTEGFLWKKQDTQRISISLTVLFVFVIVELCNRGNGFLPQRLATLMGAALRAL